jgi:hypothetical protein
MTLPLAFNGNQITVRAERVSLTDMWKAAGSDPSKRPVDWLRSKAATDFIAHVELIVGNSHLYETSAGKRGGTFAHWQIALAYAKYLSPEFHFWCNTVIRERMERRSLSDYPTVLDAESRNVFGGIVKGIIHKELLAVVPSMVQAELAGDRNRLVVDNLTVGEVLDHAGVASKGRRGLVNRVSRSLAKFSLGEGQVPRRTHAGRGGVCVYSPELLQRWLATTGRTLIASHRADRPVAHDMFASFATATVKP